jgi:hypothetical protein
MDRTRCKIVKIHFLDLEHEFNSKQKSVGVISLEGLVQVTDFRPEDVSVVPIHCLCSHEGVYHVPFLYRDRDTGMEQTIATLPLLCRSQYN